MIKKGFTLIETIIAMAILLVVITIIFSVLSQYFAIRVFYDQQTALERNLVYALDSLSSDFKQATAVGNTVFVSPSDNSMIDASPTNRLSFYDASGNTVSYFLQQQDGMYAIYKQYGNSTAYAITDNMPELVKLYFVRRGGEIIATIVGKYEYGGKQNTLSFTSIIYSRNSPQATPST